MKEKLVSIALATFNGELYLEQLLDSIYNQTYSNIEVVVCDDKSTDNTHQILAKFSEKLQMRYYVNEEKLGISKNFERAISFCKGEYIALSDQDDVWFPSKIEELVFFIVEKEKNQNDIPILVHSDCIISDKYLNIINERFIGKHGLLTGLINILFGNAKVQGASCLFNRKFRENVFPLPNGIVLYDLYFSLYSDTIGKRYFINKSLMYYRQHGNNALGANAQKRTIAEKIFRNKIILISKEEPETLDLFYKRYHSELSDFNRHIIDEYFVILSNKESLFNSLYKIINNRFNYSNSKIKLIVKYLLWRLQSAK